MARLRSPDYRGVWDYRILAEPDTGDPKLNGPYRGSLPVQVLAPGICGADRRVADDAPAHGQVWRMGPLVVRVVQVTRDTVRFLELTHGRNLRTIRRCDFLRRAHRKARA
jgi:hypothetical protein